MMKSIEGLFSIPRRGAAASNRRLREALIVSMLLCLLPFQGAGAQPFPALFSLESLLAGEGGDGSQGFVINGITAGDELGIGLASAGDLNGDGFDDIVIGASNVDFPGELDNGQVYVIYGRDAAVSGDFPAEIELSDLLADNGGDGSLGFVINGSVRSGRLGPAAGLGDVNGDGRDDLLVSAWSANAGLIGQAGIVYVIFGRHAAADGPFPAAFDLQTLLPVGGGDGSQGFALFGVEPGGFIGERVSSVGDTNGDGINELLVAAPRYDVGSREETGHIYLVLGRDTAVEGNFPPLSAFGALLPASGGDGTLGTVFLGIDAEDEAGSALAAAGDINGDGLDDILIGASAADPLGLVLAGEAYLVFGAPSADALFPLISLLPQAGGDGTTGVYLRGGLDFDFLATSVAGIGDVNNDGVDDLLLGAPSANPNGVDSGESFVIYGRDTVSDGDFPATIAMPSLLPGLGGDGSVGFVLRGFEANGDSGIASAGVGDVNGDGVDDILIGASGGGGEDNVGDAYLLYGRDAETEGSFAPIVEFASLLPALGGDGSLGSVLRGVGQFDRTGEYVSAAGDVNGDGLQDLLIAAPMADPGGRAEAGRVFVLFGRADPTADP